jgi:Kef-type K+ transport system membrane component KefB
MVEANLLRDIALAIVGAAALGLFAHFCRLPLLLGYIAAGAILGPHFGLGLIRGHQSIASIAEIGLVLLLFILGLEIDLSRLLRSGKAILLNGVIQFFGCLALALGYFQLLGFGAGGGRYDLLYLGLACSMSSTLIVVKILSDRMELESPTSQLTVGILVIQDVWAIVFLGLQPNLSDFRATVLLRSLAGVGTLVGVAWLLARYALPRLLKRAAKTPELMLVLTMSWAFAMAGLANALHLSMEMGALVAGVAVASFPYRADVVAKVSSLRDFFITLFFVALGLQLPVPSAAVLELSAAIFLFVQVSRILTVFPTLYILGYGTRASLVPAINLSQISEFALVLTGLGLGLGHIGADVASAVILALVASALVSAFAIPRTHQICRWAGPLLERLGLRDGARPGGPEMGPSGVAPARIVFMGFSREASSLLHEMLDAHAAEMLRDLLVVDFNAGSHHKLEELGVRCEYGDISHPETLVYLHLERSELLVCTIPDHIFKANSNLNLLHNLKKLAPSARVILVAETMNSARELYHDGADYVFLPRVVLAKHLIGVISRMLSGETAVVRASAEAEVGGRQEALP